MSQAAAKYINHLFDDTTEGYIQLVGLNKTKVSKIQCANNRNIAEVTKELQGNKDTYITPNTMYKYNRSVQDIRQFRALYIDIDNIDDDILDTAYKVIELSEDDSIPKPTMIVSSGRGLHIYWRIENSPYGALHTWQELEDNLYKKLKPYGADRQATDGARLLRLPGTINSKNNKECRVLYVNDDITYSMYDLRGKYLNYKPNISQNKAIKHNKTIVNLFNSYTLHIGRINDIETLCKLREYDLKGYRNMIIHCYAYWKGIYTRDMEQLEKEVQELNNLFNDPLKESEVKAIMRCVPKAIDKFIEYEQGLRSGETKRVTKGMRDKAGYWYTNQTLIDRLDITLQEQRELKTIIGKEEKYRRNNLRRRNERRNEEGLTPKQAKLKAMKEEILKLKSEELTNKKIAEIMGVNIKTLERHITSLKKEGIL